MLNDVPTVGSRIKRRRERAGLTQQELANRCRVAISQVSRWERDEGEPNLESLRALLRELELTFEELVAGTKP